MQINAQYFTLNRVSALLFWIRYVCGVLIRFKCRHFEMDYRFVYEMKVLFLQIYPHVCPCYNFIFSTF